MHDIDHTDIQQREFSRVVTHLAVEVVTDDARRITGKIQNLSLNGILLATPWSMPVAARCTVILKPAGAGDAFRIKAGGHVVRSDEGSTAIEFDEILGIDSLHHLKQIIMHNASDPDQAELEFERHLGLKRPALRELKDRTGHADKAEESGNPGDELAPL